MTSEVVNWVDWFSASRDEADHLEQTRQAMILAGFKADPDTVIEVARYILSDSRASSKLRKLADVWERRAEAGNPLELASNG